MDQLFVEKELFGRLAWFIKVRWAFIVGLLLTLLIGRLYGIELPS